MVVPQTSHPGALPWKLLHSGALHMFPGHPREENVVKPLQPFQVFYQVEGTVTLLLNNCCKPWLAIHQKHIIFYCSKIPRPQLFFSDQSNTHLLLISKVLTDYLPMTILNPPLGLGYQGLTFLMGLGQKIAPKGNPPLYNHCFQSQKYVKEIVFSDQTWQVGWHLSQTNTRRGACYICPTRAKVWVDSARKLKSILYCLSNFYPQLLIPTSLTKTSCLEAT